MVLQGDAAVIAVGITFGVLIISVVASFFFPVKKRDIPEETPSEDVKAIRAIVREKKLVGGYSGGYKNPQYNLRFLVLFLTDSGEEKAYDVPEELFTSISEGMSGTLVTMNGNFYDFGEGENIA